MGAISEMDLAQKEQGEVAPFTLSSDASETPAPAAFDDEARQQAEAELSGDV